MKRVSLFSIWIVAAMFVCHAQQRKASCINTENFPEVSFVWNDYNPSKIDSSAVSIMIDGQSVPCKWKHVEKPMLPTKNKSILILWEDMASHSGQSDFTLQMLGRFFDGRLNAGDRFNLVVFNRDSGKGSFLNSISNGFTDKTNQIKEALLAYNFDSQRFKQYPLSSNVYQAISEGLELLEKEPNGNIKAVVVVTAGYNMPTAGAPKEFSGIEAVNRNIPVYIVKYPLNDDLSRKDVDGIEKSTFGKMIMPANMKDVDGAMVGLRDAYRKMAARHYGNDYKVSFSAPCNRDGKPHTITLNINGVDNKVQYVAPGFSLVVWVEENPVWTAVIVLCIVLVLAALCFLFISANRKRKHHEAELLRQSDERQRQNEDTQRELQEQIRKEREARDRAFAEQRMEAARVQDDNNRQQEMSRLVGLMQTKNLYPRLICNIDDNLVTYNIRTPYTSIGRGSDNDIVFSNMTVSHEHAIIVFNGSTFEIQNLSNTNKTIVNGLFVDLHPLKSGDIISIGKVKINFYL